ncbi:hypothetical protein BDZ89DRAFT_1162428 [Hymenopellis radicata]|nr:hypothetical protein BDZ89DRAFT_1162428 [Hymenopellis radicata]
MDSHLRQLVIIVIGFLRATWGLSLSIISVLVTLVLPSFLRPQPPARIPVQRKRRAISLPGRRRRHQKSNSTQSTSNESSILPRRERHSMDIPIRAVHLRALSVQSETSSMHTSSEESFFTSTNPSSENIAHRRGFSLKRAWNKTRPLSPFPRHSREPTPGSPYSRLILKTKSIFKSRNGSRSSIVTKGMDPVSLYYAWSHLNARRHAPTPLDEIVAHDAHSSRPEIEITSMPDSESIAPEEMETPCAIKSAYLDNSRHDF